MVRGSRERSFGVMRLGLTLLARNLETEVAFGSERVVRRAIKREVLGSHRSAARERVMMMNFEAPRLAASRAARVDVSATPSVAREDFASHRRRDVMALLV